LDIPLIEMDVIPLMEELPEQKREEVRKELLEVVKYKQRVAELKALAQSTNKRQKKPKRPYIKAIPSNLLKTFNVLLHQKLNI
jgi:effector-binding domain-containing protein